jgi:hypothetical protein
MHGRRRHSIHRVAPGAVLLACVLLGAFGPRSTQAQCETQKLTVPDGIMGFVSVSGNAAVHGNPEGNGGIGAAYVYRRDGLSWVLEAELAPPEPDPDDMFGKAVAVSGEVVVVGADGTSTPEFMAGAVHVYRYDAAVGQWRHEAMLTASDGEAGDIFGWSVAADGDVILIGARDDEVNGESQAGSAYVFRFTGTEWVEEAKLLDPEPGYFALVGQSVSADGDLALVGAHGDGWLIGAAFVYRYDGSHWAFEEKLIAPDPGGQERFGYAVALRGNTAVAGAPQADGQNGAVYVFQREGGHWSFEARLSAADPTGPFPFLGAAVSVACDADVILAGAPYDRALGFDAGAAHVFRNTGGGWEETAKLTNSDGAPLDLFGGSVSLDSDVAMIAASGAIPAATYAFAGFSGIDCNDNGNPDACDIFAGFSEDLNVNGIPDECEAIGDLNGDGLVNVRDLLALLAAWGACDEPCPPACMGDTNGDCQVDYVDLLTLLSNWGARR